MPNKVATLLFLRKDNQILLAIKKRGFGKGYWNGAGGKIELGETVEQAMVRESEEEIAVTPTVYEKVAEHDFHMDTDTGEPWHMYVHTFIATKWIGEPTESDEMAPQWFALENIPYDAMWQDDPLWLPQVLDGNKLCGSYRFDSNQHMLSYTICIVKELPHAIPH